MFPNDANKQWLIEYLSQILGVPPQEIDTQRTFAEYGLESGMAMGLTADFESRLKVELSLDVLFEHPTIDALAGFVQANYDSLPKA